MESAQAIRTRTVPSLQSEQQLVDCDGYDLGCRGGFLGNAFRWVIQIGGIIWAPLYPYIGMSGMCQRFKPAAVRLRSYRWVVPNEVSLMQAVAQQPVAVTI
nr:ervatamin-B-like [Setaria viridis]